ncbi:MAG: hypothetical protein ACRCZ9_12450, partial [Fusobacteriaceae bacterium]
PNIPSLAEAAKGYRSDPTKGVSMNYLNDGLNNIGATTNVSAYNNTSDIIDNLARGQKSILLSKTSAGNPHYVYAKGLDDNGNVIMADPMANGVKNISPNSSMMKNVKAGIDIGGFGDGVDPPKDVYDKKETSTMDIEEDNKIEPVGNIGDLTQSNSFIESMSNMTAGVSSFASKLLHGMSGGAISLDTINESLGAIFGKDKKELEEDTTDKPGDNSSKTKDQKSKLETYNFDAVMKAVGTNDNMDERAKAAKWISHHEGFKNKMYPDEGGVSIGHGIHIRDSAGKYAQPENIVSHSKIDHWLKGGTITSNESISILRNILKSTEASLKKGDWYSKLSKNRRAAMLDMGYNLGPAGLINNARDKNKNWPRFNNALIKGSFSDIENNILGSTYSRQTGNRPYNIINMLKKDAAGPFDGLIKGITNSIKSELKGQARGLVNSGTKWVTNGLSNAASVGAKHVTNKVNSVINSGFDKSKPYMEDGASWLGKKSGNIFNWLFGKKGGEDKKRNPFMTKATGAFNWLLGKGDSLTGGLFGPMFSEMFSGFNKDGNILDYVLKMNNRSGNSYNRNKNSKNNKSNSGSYMNGLYGNGPFDGLLKGITNSIKNEVKGQARGLVNSGTKWVTNGLSNAASVGAKHVTNMINSKQESFWNKTREKTGTVSNWFGKKAGGIYNWLFNRNNKTKSSADGIKDSLNIPPFFSELFKEILAGFGGLGDITGRSTGFRNKSGGVGGYTGSILNRTGSGEDLTSMNKQLHNSRVISNIKSVRDDASYANELKESIKNTQVVQPTPIIKDSNNSRRSDDRNVNIQNFDNTDVISAINNQTQVLSSLLNAILGNSGTPITLPGQNNNTTNINSGGGTKSPSNFLEEIARISRGRG